MLPPPRDENNGPNQHNHADPSGADARTGDLMTAPSVTYSHEPPHELRQVAGLALKPPKDFIGYVSLAISKRIVESGRLEKCVTLVESYRSFLMYHVQGAHSLMPP